MRPHGFRASPERVRSSPHRHRRVDQRLEEPTPICRCRVLYLGSAVPHVTKDGLQGIQEPLKELYPEEGAVGAKGIDSWLSVWSNGFLLENVDENRKRVTRFFPIESLHYCAAVRYVLVPGSSEEESKVTRFLPLDSPFARNPNLNHPPLFAAILRRTSGIKVLECHAFICKRETAANALVRCSFHSYADSTYAKHLESGQSLYGTPANNGDSTTTPNGDAVREYQQSVIEVSEDSINSIEKVEEWKVLGNGTSSTSPVTRSPKQNGNADEISVYNGDDNHKVWAGKTPPPHGDSPDNIYDYGSTLRSFRSNVSGMSRNRPRQMVMPSSPPPPPIPEELSKDASPEEEGGGRKDKKKKRRSKSRENTLNRHEVNGSVNGRKSAASLMGITAHHHHHHHHHQQQQHLRSNGQFQHHPLPPPPPPPPQPPPHPMMMTLRPAGKKSGTFSSRSKTRHPFIVYPPPPHLMPPPGHPLYGMHTRPLEEPIYMPHSARPMSPIASYQPGHFPHEAYYNQQQYATIDKKGRPKKSNKEGEDFNRKGHINERAFSYSIRNEQRSRSYGSLASAENNNKQEMFQMMTDMNLDGDQIERREVPPGLYPPGRGGYGPPPPHFQQSQPEVRKRR